MATASPISLLSVTISPSPSAADSNPAVALTAVIKNNSPSEHLSLLTWSTPLDPTAIQQGVFQLVSKAGETVPSLEMMVNHQLPPTAEDIVELAPGAQLSQEVVISAPMMSLKADTEYSVVATGRYHGVWTSVKGQVLEQSGKDGVTGDWVSNEITVKT